MTVAFFEGIILGITLAFLIGPAFFSLLQTSIHRGFFAGIQFAAGIAFSDITLIGLSYLGALQLINDEQNKVTVGIVGGSVLILFGIITFTRKYKATKTSKIEIKIKAEKFMKYFFKGYFINILNPFLFIFWLGVVSFISTKYGIHSKETTTFFVGVIFAVFSTDTIKCFIAHRIKKYLRIKVLTLINRVVGILLIVFGVVMFLRIFYL
ncbi:MAG: LysE family translocator [Bacteroidales bacterium]